MFIGYQQRVDFSSSISLSTVQSFGYYHIQY